ncbi:hypothetical protein SPFL3102_01014 [Sporomusaceae bacterium FL31]|nr:hypothetical protein SPFL3101_03065 [Sporomusaceae bacterium FL31]GCE33213.1 hypothetical protein SPFL3102_01014 [Sporomusaceae bacterium]
MITYEKRGFIRVIVDFLVTIEADNSLQVQQWPAKAQDVSLDGIRLMCLDTLHLNTSYLLRFPLEWSNLCVHIAVMRQEEANYGCMFIDMCPETRKTLDQLIYQQWRQSVREGSHLR